MAKGDSKQSSQAQRQPPQQGAAVPRTGGFQNPTGPYPNSPNPGRSGGDPRGRIQNQGNYQQGRFENYMDPLMNQMGGNYGRAAEQGFQDYGNIMGRLGGVGDQFAQWSQTGGFSPEDIANMRSRGTAPVRAAYANAEREVGRQRALQGGYSPNAVATQAKMAREQGQAGADAMQNVEATLAEMRQKGRLAGMQGQLGAGQAQAGLYGTTPGMASMFGNQALQAGQTSGNFGTTLVGQDIAGQGLPGQYEDVMGKIGTASEMAYPWLERIEDFFKPKQQSQGPVQGPPAPASTGWNQNSFRPTSPQLMPQQQQPQYQGSTRPYQGLFRGSLNG